MRLASPYGRCRKPWDRILLWRRKSRRGFLEEVTHQPEACTVNWPRMKAERDWSIEPEPGDSWVLLRSVEDQHRPVLLETFLLCYGTKTCSETNFRERPV